MLGVADQKLSLINIGGGAAVEKFDVELQKVLDNIADPNSVETAPRSITLKVTFKPKERTYTKIGISCKSALAEDDHYSTNAYIGASVNGKAEAYEHNPEQMKLAFEQRQKDQAELEKEEAAQSAGNITNINRQR